MNWAPPTISADVVIVGGGLAGLSALRAARGRRIVVLHPPRERGSSALAQGGIAAALQHDVGEHVRDTCGVAAGHADIRRTVDFIEEGRSRVRELVREGMPFDRTTEGDLAFGLEAGHSRPRILHADGDRTGAALVSFLVARARRQRHVQRVSGTAIELLRDDEGRIAGLVFRGTDEENGLVLAPHVVLATGGICALFGRTTNGPMASGEGLALAVGAGASVVDMEFVQFHPTALDVASHPLPLVTEALRGAGAHLVNHRGDRIMDGVHPLLELAPRDIVARAVWDRQCAGERVYLDTVEVKALDECFPSLTATCARFDICRDRIPVTPAAHFHMGGIEVDDDGATGVEGLWACGEVACTGVHGANRLASNSMLEALVFGTRVGGAIAAASTDTRRPNRWREQRDSPANGDMNAALPGVLSAGFGVSRERAAMQSALAWLEAASRRNTNRALGRRLCVAQLLGRAALYRRESRGAHYRPDHPTASDEFQYRLRQQLLGDDFSLSRAPLASSPPSDHRPGHVTDTPSASCNNRGIP